MKQRRLFPKMHHARVKMHSRIAKEAETGTRRCSICDETKSLDAFSRSNKDKQAHVMYCDACWILLRREQNLSESFGLTLEEYDMLAAYQNNTCPICKKARSTGSRQLSIDHSHETGLLRGLACWHCNSMLGLARDKREVFLNAIEYLDDPPAVAVLGKRYAVKGRMNTKKYRLAAKKMGFSTKGAIGRVREYLRKKKHARPQSFIGKPDEQPQSVGPDEPSEKNVLNSLANDAPVVV